jgi:hypothetical protein
MLLKQPVAKANSRTEFDQVHFKYRINTVFITIVVMLCAYLMWPTFNAVHLEGFTAQTESIAMLMSRAPGIEHDPYLPLVSQFIYQTRSAVIDALAIIYKISPTAGDWAFQGLVFSGFILLIIASIIFARRWGNIPPVFAMFALVLTQGIPETAFFFNDNIISAAFATTSLTLISKKLWKIEWLLSGIFLGLAILSRADAVFMLPMVIGIVFYSYKNNRDCFLANLIICLGTALVLIVSAIYHGFSLIDVFSTAKKFVFFDIEKARWFWIRILFIGLGTLPLLALGLWLGFRRLKSERSTIGLLTFIFYPGLLAIFAPKATEIRYIFPLLAPVVAIHVGTGLKWVYEQYVFGTGEKRRYAIGISVFAILIAILPPTQLKMFDGPRALIGRLWTPILWSQWQGSVDESMRRLNGLVDALDDNQLNIVISTHYNDEFYVRLRLIEDGFIPMAVSNLYPGCSGFSLLKKGGSIVAHIRTDPQYQIAPLSMPYNAALQISSAFSCSEILPYRKIYISTFGNNIGVLPPAIYNISPFSFKGPMTVEFMDMRVKLTPSNPKLIREFGILDFREMTSEELRETLLNAKIYLMLYPETDPVTGKIVTIEDYRRYYNLLPGPTSNLLDDIQRRLNITEGKELKSAL